MTPCSPHKVLVLPGEAPEEEDAEFLEDLSGFLTERSAARAQQDAELRVGVRPDRGGLSRGELRAREQLLESRHPQAELQELDERDEDQALHDPLILSIPTWSDASCRQVPRDAMRGIPLLNSASAQLARIIPGESGRSRNPLGP